MNPHFILTAFVTIIFMVHSMPQSSNTSPSCSSFNSFGYYCVPYFQCDKKGHIVTDGVGLLDPRSSDDEPRPLHEVALTGTCSGLIEVCCLLADPDKKAPTSPESPPSQPLCGRHNDIDARFGSLEKTDTKFAEWPHVCAVLNPVKIESTGEKVPVYQCAGSIIASGVILTAAHCVHNNVDDPQAKLVVRCGEWDTGNQDEPKKHQERYVEKVILHPDFDRRNLRNNFALLITEEDFQFDDHIFPVCLPSSGDMFKPQECVANGWGKDKFGNDGSYQPILKEVTLGLVGQDECQSRLRETRLGSYFELHNSFICAGGERGVDTCKGDGGGPLTCRHGDSGPWVQAGIVSWGIGCGDDIPAVYARVSKAVCWMDQILRCYFGTDESVFGYPLDDCGDDVNIDCSILDFANPRSAEDDIFNNK